MKGGLEGGKRGRETKKERLIYLVEYNFLCTKHESRDLFLGNDESSEIWCLCKADSLVFLRQGTKWKSSRVTAANPALEGTQLMW